MAARKKSGGRKYGKAAGKSVKSAMHREKRGTLKSGKGGKGGTVTSRKQAIAIGLSEARKKGAKVPRKKNSADRTTQFPKTRRNLPAAVLSRVPHVPILHVGFLSLLR
jgi:hypothetical protein